MQEKMYRLYDAVIENDILTEDVLSKYDITLEEIDKLVYEGVLAETSGSEYIFLDYENLCDYAWILSSQKEFEKAKICLNKVIDFNPKSFKACYRLFYESVFSNDERYILPSLLKLHMTHDKDFIVDNNICLYLLSFNMKLPEMFKEYVNLLKEEDVILSGLSLDYYWHNEIYNYIYFNKFKYAFKRLNDYIAKNDHHSMRSTLLKTLLIRTMETQNNYTQNLVTLINEKKYQEALDLLKGKPNLTSTEKTYVRLLEVICLQQETGIYQKSTGFQTPSVFKAINRGNYVLAHQICENNDKKNGDNSILNILLKEINNLNNKNYLLGRNEDLENIITSLRRKSDDYLELIEQFLEKYNKTEYFSLIQNLITLCDLKGDRSYLNPLLILNKLKNNDFSINLNEYLELFEQSLQERCLEEAKIYLNIILNLNEITDSKVDLHELKMKLEELTCDIKDEYDLSIDELIKFKYNELLERQGIVLLKPLDPIATQVVIRKINQEYDDVSVISIGFKETRQLVFIYKPKLRAVDNPKDLLEYSDELYRNGKYEEAKDSYLKLIQFGKPKYFIYAKVGLCYLKINDKKTALEYLMVANNMIKKENITERSYDELIESLTKEIQNTSSEFKLDEILGLKLRKD